MIIVRFCPSIKIVELKLGLTEVPDSVRIGPNRSTPQSSRTHHLSPPSEDFFRVSIRKIDSLDPGGVSVNHDYTTPLIELGST